VRYLLSLQIKASLLFVATTAFGAILEGTNTIRAFFFIVCCGSRRGYSIFWLLGRHGKRRCQEQPTSVGPTPLESDRNVAKSLKTVISLDTNPGERFFR
jgi:hypothetical protein